VDPNGNAMVAISLNCLEDFDPASVPVQHYDGRSL
jgi:predicted component of type VI protein secretion system